MPTLHLIDPDSTQACPAVMAAVRAQMAAGDGRDKLLLLGGPPLEGLARCSGIEDIERIAPPFGSARFAPGRLRRWANAHPGFDRIHCWSLGALHAAGFVFNRTPMCFSLIHRPDDAQLIRLRKFCKSPWSHPVRVTTHTKALCSRLESVGITVKIDPALTQNTVTSGTPPRPDARDALRAGWQAPETTHRVVALLSDHPSQVNAMDAAAIVCLAGASLTDDQGQRLSIKLVMHPGQRNRQRAQYFLADQSDYHRVIQDVWVTEPWEILPGCDAALALGPDAGGLSLHWALNSGVPVVTAAPSAADGEAASPANLLVARSSAHKDIAHQLHQAHAKFRVAQVI